MTTLENLKRLVASRVDQRELVEKTRQALEKAIADGDGTFARMILEWASKHIDRHTLIEMGDFIWRRQARIDFAKGKLEKLLDTFNEMDTIKENGNDVMKKPDCDAFLNKIPYFIKNNMEYLEKENSQFKKICLVMNKNTIRIENSKLIESQPEELTKYISIAAESAGKKVKILNATRFSYDNGLYPGLENLPDVNEILTEILDFDPDLVFIDGNYVPNNFGLVPERLLYLRQRSRAKFVAMVGDNHGASGEKNCQFWSAYVDLVLSFEPSTQHPKSIQKKVKLIFIPIAISSDRESIKNNIVYYSGTPRGDRVAYIAALKKNNVPVDYNFGSRNSSISYDIDKYSQSLASSQIVLNSGRRSPFPIGPFTPTTIVTARAFEAISVGSLLLERKGSRLCEFFNPGEHYYEFDSLDDLVFKARILIEDKIETDKISKQGKEFSNKYYSGRNFWNMISNLLIT